MKDIEVLKLTYKTLGAIENYKYAQKHIFHSVSENCICFCRWSVEDCLGNILKKIRNLQTHLNPDKQESNLINSLTMELDGIAENWKENQGTDDFEYFEDIQKKIMNKLGQIESTLLIDSD